MSRRSEIIAGHIARAIVNNTRKHWRSLHCDAVSDTEREIIRMSTPTSSNNLNVNGDHSRVQIGRLNSDDPRVLSAQYGRKEAPPTEGAPTSPAKAASGENTRPVGMVSQMTCDGAQLDNVVARPVDRKTITGSTPGDWRSRPGDTARASLDRVSDNGGPRKPMGQFRNSKNAPDKPGFQSTVLTTGEEAGD